MYSNSKKVEGLEISDEILETLDYKNTTILMTFISDQGKILPRRTTNLTSKQQKKVQKQKSKYYPKHGSIQEGD